MEKKEELKIVFSGGKHPTSAASGWEVGRGGNIHAVLAENLMGKSLRH
jgi:hypothetical protein